ncbi:helix-turn-helix transcriptional regulator [Natronorubrum sp. FCH18a]|uniref:helix-turn-helix transcriptional regulator n=1 Tax=Natronorubrum sp. FCH18a TaxID=3447018 RepID=UPI003F5101B7
MNLRVALLVLLVGVGTVATAPMTAAQPSSSDSVSVAGEPEEIDADETRLDISLQEDGSAEWSVEFWVRLDDTESTEAFESIRDDIDEDPDAYTDQFADRIDDTVATAVSATDREMSAEEFTVDTARQSFGAEYGVVRYTFKWHGFAAVDGDELHAGDAIEGLYLDDETRLSISRPDAYHLVSVGPEPDDERDRTVIWHGSETDFVSGEPRVVVSTGGTGLGVTAIGAAALLVVVVGVGAAWWYRTRTPVSTQSDDSPSHPSAEASETTPSTTAAGTDATPDPRDDLLSNEEQVLRLLEEYDGRMKQQAVVEELGWTDAKTSKVISSLREDGDLESFRLGRENVLSLPTDDGASDAAADSVQNG